MQRKWGDGSKSGVVRVPLPAWAGTGKQLVTAVQDLGRLCHSQKLACHLCSS